LVDLFSTIGKVERAEIQYEPNGRSRGTGVVEFDTADNAETAISKSNHLYQSLQLGACIRIIDTTGQPNSQATSMVVALLD
jgi:RNA recognition motif-containing protein